MSGWGNFINLVSLVPLGLGCLAVGITFQDLWDDYAHYKINDENPTRRKFIKNLVAENISILRIVACLWLVFAILTILIPPSKSSIFEKYASLENKGTEVLEGIALDYVKNGDFDTYSFKDTFPFTVNYGDILEMPVRTPDGIHQDVNVLVIYSDMLEDNSIIPFSDKGYERFSKGEIEKYGGSSGGVLVLSKRVNEGHGAERIRLSELDYIVNVKLKGVASKE